MYSIGCVFAINVTRHVARDHSSWLDSTYKAAFPTIIAGTQRPRPSSDVDRSGESEKVASAFGLQLDSVADTRIGGTGKTLCSLTDDVLAMLYPDHES